MFVVRRLQGIAQPTGLQGISLPGEVDPIPIGQSIPHPAVNGSLSAHKGMKIPNGSLVPSGQTVHGGDGQRRISINRSVVKAVVVGQKHKGAPGVNGFDLGHDNFVSHPECGGVKLAVRPMGIVDSYAKNDQIRGQGGPLPSCPV